METTVHAIAAIYGGTAQIHWDGIASAVINNPDATQEVSNLIAAQRPDLIVKSDRPFSLGGDNFAEFLLQVPGVYVHLGTAHPQKPETQFPIHSGQFQLDEDALPIGAWLYAACAEAWLAP